MKRIAFYLSLVLVVLVLLLVRRDKRTCLPPRPAVGLTKYWS